LAEAKDMKRKLIITFVFLIFVLLLAAIIIPNFISPRTFIAQTSCINNLRQLEGAKLQWQSEKHKTTNDIPTLQDITPYLHLRIVCPEGGTYTIGRLGEPPKCSIGGNHVLP
jgi:hypothetical protein